MIAFIAWTPLHVINILNTKLAYFEKESADIFIYNEFENADSIYENLKKEQVFKNVYLVDYKMMGNQFVSKLNVLMNKNKMIPEAEPFNYDMIFTQGGNYFLKILFAKAKKNNPLLKLNYIEDGLATYSSFDFRNISRHREIIINLLNPYSIFKENYNEYFIYKPEIAHQIEKTQVRRLPKIKPETKLMAILNRVFNLQKQKMDLKNTIIFFDQPHINKALENLENMAFNQIVKNRGKMKVLVKLHPRSNPDKYDESVTILDTNLPWELCCLIYDIDDLITISLYSTASISSSLMFDLDSKNIILAKMLKDDPKYYDLIAKDKETVLKLQDLYQIVSKFEDLNKSNINLPNTEAMLLKELKSSSRDYSIIKESS